MPWLKPNKQNKADCNRNIVGSYADIWSCIGLRARSNQNTNIKVYGDSKLPVFKNWALGFRVAVLEKERERGREGERERERERKREKEREERDRERKREKEREREREASVHADKRERERGTVRVRVTAWFMFVFTEKTITVTVIVIVIVIVEVIVLAQACSGEKIKRWVLPYPCMRFNSGLHGETTMTIRT